MVSEEKLLLVERGATEHAGGGGAVGYAVAGHLSHHRLTPLTTLIRLRPPLTLTLTASHHLSPSPRQWQRQSKRGVSVEGEWQGNVHCGPPHLRSAMSLVWE
mmetsp:Transcript_57941/g.136538  ORF Transcript_57941/g.136538 Transcript_57941/m.136538 type:complete len:102 (-) Transcript_57941:1055-1360(-)